MSHRQLRQDFVAGNGASLAQSAQRGWHYVGGIPVARYCAVGVSLYQRNLAFFGFGANSVGNVVDWWIVQYNASQPALTKWQAAAAPPLAGRCYGTAAALESLVFVGFGASNDDWWRYDSSDGSWIERAKLPSSPLRAGPLAVSLNGLVYVGFGVSSTVHLQDWWAFNDTVNAWTPKQSLPAAGRVFPVGAVVNGKVYAGLGSNSSAFFTDWYEYDPQTDDWTAKASFPFGGGGRSQTSATVVQGRIIIALGNGEASRGAPFADLWVYDPILNTWTAVPDVFPGLQRGQHVAFSVNNGTAMLIGSGSDVLDRYHASWWSYVPP